MPFEAAKPASSASVDHAAAVMDMAIDRLEELRQQCNSLKAANEGWKHAFCDLYDALDRIADLAKPGQELSISEAIDVICDIYNVARDALHTEEA